ncbi:MAG: hypothetical protein JXP34_04275 [Planctomycetes bacterium]|nr:hypothetical protein [Planctomycetota bacterium]
MRNRMTRLGCRWVLFLFAVAAVPCAAAEGESFRPAVALEGHRREIRSVAISPDGKRIASGGEDRLVILWDAAAAKKLLELRHPGPVRALAFSPDGASLAAGGGEAISVWKVPSGEGGQRAADPHGVWGLAFAENGSRLASASGNRIKIWSWREGECLREYRTELESLRSLAITAGGQGIAAGGEGTGVKSPRINWMVHCRQKSYSRSARSLWCKSKGLTSR